MNEQPLPRDLPDSLDADFLDRLRRDELRVNSAELNGNPFDPKTTWLSAFRASGSRGWTAAALAIAVLMLGWHLRPKDSSETVLAASPDGVARLTAADPRPLRQQIVDELHAAGVPASGYEQLAINGVDADIPQPTSPAVIAILQKHRVPTPPDGTLRIEIKSER